MVTGDGRYPDFRKSAMKMIYRKFPKTASLPVPRDFLDEHPPVLAHPSRVFKSNGMLFSVAIVLIRCDPMPRIATPRVEFYF